ncbi:SMC family ATPase, partial [Streptomyces sp. 8K308]|uniref:SbcC/MukB-like Walker B domain-containing protein n=1 Tax=Streptomyces sp. 8K308 TaxID=2530388 RepID=UPI0010D66B2A
RPTSDHVDRAAEEAARAAHQAAERHRAQAGQDLAALRADHAAAAAEAGDEPAEALTGAVRALEADLAAARAEAAGEPAARQAIAAAEAAHARLLDQRRDAERRGAARASRRAALAAELTALRAEIDRARADAPTVADRAAALNRRAEALALAAAAARAAQETADRRKQADGRLADAAYQAGFDSPRAAAEAALPEVERARLRRRVDAWLAERAAVAAALADPAATAAAAEPPAEPEAARAALATAAGRLRAAATAEAAARARRAELDALSATAAADATELAPLRVASRRITRLASLAAGTSPENEYRMRLETYVLAARLEQVAAVASARLHRMSAGRYTLVHTDARAAHRARSGLGLLVMDAWTGRARDTATLSGGESFFVSLALALGLADVVAEEAGGPRLETLFVDEGFGSLDEQSLDEVLDVLDGLREHDRSVAIVSHVPDLRARIPAQLEVVKTRRGSTVRHRTG